MIFRGFLGQTVRDYLVLLEKSSFQYDVFLCPVEGKVYYLSSISAPVTCTVVDNIQL